MAPPDRAASSPVRWAMAPPCRRSEGGEGEGGGGDGEGGEGDGEGGGAEGGAA